MRSSALPVTNGAYPLPEKSAIEFILELYAPTVITLLDVEGSVNVV